MPSDLVEYLVLSVPSEFGLTTICSALVALIDDGTIGVLDLVVVDQPASGPVKARPRDALPMPKLRSILTATEPVLSAHDIELSSMALPPNSIGLIVVTVDLWAEPLTRAAEDAGGRIVAGDRLSIRRLEAVLGDSPPEQEEGQS